MSCSAVPVGSARRTEHHRNGPRCGPYGGLQDKPQAFFPGPRMPSFRFHSLPRVRSVALLLMALMLGFAPRPAAGEAVPDYETRIKPLLRDRCITCHGQLRQRYRACRASMRAC